MLEHIKAFFAKLPVRNMSKRKVLATVSALVVIVSVVTITAFAAAATYKVTVNEAGKKAYTVSNPPAKSTKLLSPLKGSRE